MTGPGGGADPSGADASAAARAVVARGTPERYQGHPTTLLMPDGRTVFFWALYFLYPEELQLALKEGAEALEKKLDAQRIPPGLWPRRPNVAKRRGLFG